MPLVNFLVRKKQIQIFGVDPQHLPVEHGVNVIRAALTRPHLQSLIPQSGHQRTGRRRLPAAAGRSGEKDSSSLLHQVFPLSAEFPPEDMI